MSFAEWFFSLKDQMSDEQIARLVCCLWSIWKARNGFIFESRAISPAITATLANREFMNINEARETTSLSSILRSASCHSQPRGSRRNPSPPPGPFERIVHCDGSFVSESQLAACGITIADAHGQVIDGKAERFYCSYPIQAEAFAFLGAVVLAAQVSCPTCIKSDCQRLIVALIQDPCDWPWQCRATVARIVSLLQGAPWIKLSFVPRRFNSLADWVARNARLDLLPQDWIVIANLISPLL
ncbi:unnamed protein product [Linum trigynum]|uniref:RNase H type-1 domain-containing protein n=1 Tax=Linum trigynum TaxID=586398 RepID=A0AAV2FX94_9ROSI